MGRGQQIRDAVALLGDPDHGRREEALEVLDDCARDTAQGRGTAAHLVLEALGVPDHDELSLSYAFLVVAALTRVETDGVPALRGTDLAPVVLRLLSSWEILAADPDLPAYDDRLGWVHTIAHGAELALAVAQRIDLLSAVSCPALGDFLLRVVQSPRRFSHGEETRLALAANVLLRQDPVVGSQWAHDLAALGGVAPHSSEWIGRQNALGFCHAAVAVNRAGVSIPELGLWLSPSDECEGHLLRMLRAIDDLPTDAGD